MKSGKCPKCNGEEVFSHKSNDDNEDFRCFALSKWDNIFVEIFICMDCGFMEEYAEDYSLTDPKVKGLVLKKWKKVESN
ncbi:MAG: hypothetical protein QNK23_07445 [Crocinitomicaceae bacterium]|nr:hypothetical protein [Crocinitomicaceae bacterium]